MVESIRPHFLSELIFVESADGNKFTVPINNPDATDTDVEVCPFCPHCELTFTNNEEYEHHNVEMHGKKKLLTCNYCTATFRRQDHLKRHIHSLHTSSKYCHCPVCAQDFKRQDVLMKHIKKVHSDGPQVFHCRDCEETFSTLTDLDNHEISHLLTDRHKCPHCNTSFKRKDHMLRHIKSQHLNQFVICPVCSQTYKRKDHLVRHVREKHRMGFLNGKLAPKEPEPYTGVYKADSRTVICPQFASNDPLTSSSETEECLVLNIFKPKEESNTSLPVMVFIHGGGFGVGSGSPSFYGPQYLISHNVIVVTVNYRLNVYGFLNLGVKEAPGNAGLKDIRAALRWIKENIANFGGDPDNVTVFGQGSGGIAALYLTLSESTKGLFHKVISESGSIFSPQSFDPSPLTTAKQVAKSLEVNSANPKELFKVFNDSPIEKVEEAISKQMHPKTVFLPSVETVFEGEEPFLTATPYEILSTEKHKSFNPVPIIVGINTVEGLTSTLEYNTITSQMDRLKHEDYSALDQRNFNVSKEDKEKFREMLKETYFSNITSDEAVVGGIINLNTDFSYTGPMSLFSELYANNSGLQVYQYIFNYIGNRNLGRLLTNSSLPATTNLDELFYIFELERLPLPMDENDARIVTFMTMMWSNFAKHGTPTPDSGNGEWLPYPHHLAISLEPQYVAPLTPERSYFWRSLYAQYGTDVKV